MARFTAPNGLEITGAFETCPCAVGIIDIDLTTGEPKYDGTGSKMFWDAQQAVKADGKPLYLDEEGNPWPFDQLTRHEDEENLDA